ncbi:MAG TPA: hypothetical protein VMF32_13145 [Xanthobacteraceae bacterium]|nr:hypothetical protein [Xanthobacteraceae bacterium]
MPLILTTFKERNPRYTDEDAAAALGLSASAFKSYLQGKPFTKRAQELALPKMGVATLAEAALKFDRQTDRIQIFDDLFKQSQDAFLALFDGAREIKETHVMLSVYPSLERLNHRPRLKRTMYDRLRAGDIVVRRIEQFNNLDRAVDVIHNILTFNPNHYDVRLLRNASIVFPYLQFTVVDGNSAISGGFHASDGAPHHDPFMVYVGTRYANFYTKVWEKLKRYTCELSTIRESEMLALVVAELNKLTDNEQCRDLTVSALKKLVAAHAEVIDEFPTRY